MNELNLLARRLGVPASSLRQSLTHYTFYDDKNNSDSSSRYVFAGMFVFRGILAQILFKLVPATGTQLQHILGNMIGNDRLANLFDTLKLRQFARAGDNFDIKAHKHVFTFGLLGCMATECASEEVLNSFISKHFIKPNESLLFHQTKNRDYRTQADVLAKQLVGKVLLLETKAVDESYMSIVCIKDGEQIAEALSKSYRYSRAKALKIAIRSMSDQLMKDFDKNNMYYRKLLERANFDIENKLEERARDEEQKRLVKVEREENRKKNAAARDAARRKAQAEAKERKKRKSEIETQKAVKASRPISANKRRHLEDKAK